MSCGWPRASAVLLALASLPPALAAQGREAGASVFTTTARASTAGLLAHVGWRPGGSAPRMVAALGAGVADGEVVGRGEVVAHLVLPQVPGADVAFYLGGGMAGVTGPEEAGCLVALVGVETDPGGADGFALEVGVGGGARVSAGWRRRW
jgi:hypothetical protein